MEEKTNGKSPKIGPKSFLSVGPTLHYSHKNVQRCWFASVGVYCLACLFWSKILTGTFFSFDAAGFRSIELWRIGRFVLEPVSIFEYPLQILVLGSLMAIIAATPVMVSQLMSFKHSVPFLFSTIFFANLPGFAIVILISCIAAASRPLRFRSRFIAITLCIAPQMIYWALMGSAKQVEPIKWGFSFAPWICAWLISLAITGFVLGIGHFTRYRPGLVWSSSAVILITTILLFGLEIGFDELDYQLYVAKNDPKQAVEFHDQSVKEALDNTINDEQIKEYLAGFFYSTDDTISLRIELKNKIKQHLQFGRWPSWLVIPAELDYENKTQYLKEQYNIFIERRPTSPRMPIALYYKAILNEFSPDVRIYELKEVLHFNSDYPYESTRQLWYRLYSDFPDSPESIEARWRIAKHWAGVEMFELARGILDEAIEMTERFQDNFKKTGQQEERLLGIFKSPADTTLTSFDLEQLLNRLKNLRELISNENIGATGESSKQLASFVMLNRHDPQYVDKLIEFETKINKKHPLYDNIMLEKIRIISDELLREEQLEKQHSIFSERDGGIQALYDLALLRIGLWRQQEEENAERKIELLLKARKTLNKFVELYPDNFRSIKAKNILGNLPGTNR